MHAYCERLLDTATSYYRDPGACGYTNTHYSARPRRSAGAGTRARTETPTGPRAARTDSDRPQSTHRRQRPAGQRPQPEHSTQADTRQALTTFVSGGGGGAECAVRRQRSGLGLGARSSLAPGRSFAHGGAGGGARRVQTKKESGGAVCAEPETGETRIYVFGFAISAFGPDCAVSDGDVRAQKSP